MSKNEFDAWLLKKLQEEELTYRPEHWQEVAQKLPPAPGSRKRLFVTWHAVAAGIAAVLLLTAGWTLFGPSKEPETLTEMAKITSPTAPSGLEETTTSGMPVPAPISKDTDPLTHSHLPLSPNSLGVASPHIAGKQEVATPIQHQHKQQAPQEQIAYKKEEVPPVFPKTRDDYPQVAPEPFIATTPKKQMILSVGGGVNYGSVNTGYALGVSARRNLGNNFFVDGTVAMMYNDNATQIADYNNKAVQFAARPLNGASAISTPAMSPASNRLYYLQFNPTFGYQIDKDIALSVGGDVQQMLNAQPGELKVSTADQMAKVLPAMDIGLTAKSEFNIAPHIQAGVLYREGLNNILRASNQYFNRRYFQVQFKYNIPLK